LRDVLSFRESPRGRLLVERGARLDVKNKADRTPLDVAMRARQPNEKIIALLKELAAR
jgi:ankyrin repeat protein